MHRQLVAAGHDEPVTAGPPTPPRTGDSHEDDVARPAAALERRRAALAGEWARTSGDDRGRIVAVGQENFHRWLFTPLRGWRQLDSTRHGGPRPTPDLPSSLAHNRRSVQRGLRMTSVFAAEGLPPGLVDLLAEQDLGYRVAHAPLDMKIVDGSQVLLEGPTIDGERSIMLAEDRVSLALAHTYWSVLLRDSRPADDLVGLREVLRGATSRQHAVLGLLARDATDRQVAEVLGVSLRTVGTEVAAIKRLLGVSTRFAAGLELGRLLRAVEASDPSPSLRG